jgi:hypothetical protein
VALYIDQQRRRPDPEQSIKRLTSTAVKAGKNTQALYGPGMVDAYRMLTAGARSED